MNGAGSTLDIGQNRIALDGTGVYTQGNAASQLTVAIDGTNHGQIDASAGGAAVSAGILNLTVSGYVPNNTGYTIVLGQAGSTGTTFTSIVEDSFMLSFSDTSTPTDVIVTATRSNTYNSLATNGNDRAAGSALEQAGADGAAGDMLDVLNTLDSMASAQKVSNALETMIPDMSSGTLHGTRTLNGRFLTAISNRLAYARSGFASGSGIASGDMFQGTGFWMQGLGSHSKQNERGGIQGYSANTFGTSIGMDKLLDDHFRAGFAGGYGFGAINSKTPGSPSTDINSFQGTLYASYDSVNLCQARKARKYSRTAVRNQTERLWYVDGMLSFLQNNYDSRREIWLTPTNARAAKADHHSQQYSTKMETGYTFVTEKTKNLEVTPFASLQYSYLNMNEYKEKGADALNLTVNGEGYHELLQALGTKLAYPLVSEKMGTFIPSVKAAWLYDYIGDKFETTSSFAGGGSSFTTSGAEPAKHGLLLGGELAFLNKGNMTLTANYDLELKDQFASHTYYATARYDF